MKILWNSLLCCLFFISANAQQDSRIAITERSLDQVEQMIMPALNNADLLAEELALREPGRAPRYAETMDVFITPQTNGNWEVNADGIAIWRMQIVSTGAKSLNLGFTKYIMPEGGSLILYTPDQKRVMGPFTPADNEEHEQLWTPVLYGDALVIEVQVPAENMVDLELELKTVNHDFLGFGDSDFISGSCNLDVICGEADGWAIVDGYRDIIQSVAVIGTGGGTFCTGFLVNNVRQDCTPFFMTADHCGISAGNAPSLVTYWNFQNSTCRQPGSAASGGAGDGQLNDFNTGAIFRASNGASDMTLVELDDPVSETANAFFAGWDATDAIPQSAIGVHHPSTDEKRISFEDDPTYIGAGLSSNADPNGDHVVVPDWDIGTTEPGSSGSPLFNGEKRVVGQLHGGGAACGNDAYDTYGWFHTSWDNGSPNNSLRNWLDPDNTGTLVIDGKDQATCSFFVAGMPFSQELCAPNDAVYELTVSENFLADVTVSVSNLPAGATANFSANPVSPGGTTTLTISNTGSVATGNYTFDLDATDGTETAISTLELSVFAAAPGSLALIQPVDMQVEVSPSPFFEWDAGDAQQYEFQLAEDAAFTLLIANETGLTSPNFAGVTLTESSTYYWRARGINACGEGAWATTYSFETGSCAFLTAADLPINISPQGQPTIVSSLLVNSSGVITDVNVVDLTGTHSYLGDLTFILTSPNGTSVTLISNQCGTDENFDINFDDEAPNDTPPCPYNDAGTYSPADALAAFNGENPEGVWTLTIEDNANFDGGALESWGLIICAEGLGDYSLSVSPESADVCAGNEVVVTLTAGQDFEGSVNLSATSSPAGATIDFANNPIGAGGTVQATVTNLTDAGTVTITFNADAGGNSSSATVSIDVETAPNTPDLLTPIADATMVDLMPQLTWENINNADGYILEIATDFNFTDIVYSETEVSPNHNVAQELQAETTYYWRVQAENECGASLTAPNSFTTDVNGTNDLEGNAISVLPNPTTGMVFLQFEQAFATDVQVELTGINGQTLLKKTWTNGQLVTSIDLANYPDGVYLLRLQSEQDVFVRRVVLQK